MSKSPFQKFKESGPTFLHITQKPGVYYILNTFNNCMYIGQSWRIGDRWLTHVNALNAGKHTNKALQRDWNAFGARDFEFGTLVTYEPPMRLGNYSVRYLLKLEAIFINVYQTKNPIYGYNLPPKRYRKAVTP